MQNFIFYRLSASSSPTDYRYIGVTTKTLNVRLAGHKYNALHSEKRGLPVHKWMWKHYQLGETIIIEKIYECDESCWEENEVRLIQEYKDAGYNLLNLDKGGRGIISKEKRSISSIKRSISAHEKPVYAIEPNTLTIWKEFESSTKASIYFNLKSNSSITNALNGWTKKSVGYFWVYKEDWDNGINKINTEPNFAKISNAIYRFDFEGNLIAHYKSGREFTRLSEVNDAAPVKNAIKTKKWYLNSFWNSEPIINIEEYHNVYYNIEEIDVNNNVVNKYHTQHEVAVKLNLADSTVCNSLKNKKILPNGNLLRKIVKNKI